MLKLATATMRMLFFLVFVGWLFAWVMLPTKLYKNTWTPKLKTELNSTYFREQGTNLLLFTFPIMFIAAFGGFYVYYQKISEKSSSESAKKSSRLAFLKRPVLVMAPMGIVSMMELIFALMFVVLLIWSLANYLYVSFGSLHMHKAGEKVWEAKFRSVSLRLGYIGNTCWAFLFFPVTRGSSILPLVGLTSECSIKYHIWLGHLSNVLFFAHSVGFFIYWAMTNQMVEALEWSRTYLSNVAGVIAFVVSLVMWVLSFPHYRRKMYEIFYYSHHLYIIYLIFYMLHVGVAYLCLILPGIFLFLIDRYLRYLQSRDNAMLISARLLPCDTIELNFCKSPGDNQKMADNIAFQSVLHLHQIVLSLHNVHVFLASLIICTFPGLDYKPTSIMSVNVPSISKLQWHPFTITSNSNLEPNTLSIVIKTEGRWSQKLYRELSSPLDHLDISVEGPYGPTSSHFLRREALVMISGGSGITPFISIIREVIYQSTQQSRIPKLTLVCAFNNSSHLSMLNLLLPLSANSVDTSKIQLQIEAYITQENENTGEESQNLLQTICFKPNPSATPITAVLGPNSWLWLSAIITSSFIMFLLLLAFVTRYYIYPFDHYSDPIVYHYSYRILWDMFLVCVCVLVCSSAFFVLQKKHNAKEGKQIQSSEMSNPTSPGGSYINDEGIELESLPHQSIVEATQVHLGARPDLKSILFGCKESDVGVLVCGPRKMRHEVAKICSSGLAKNLQFESISFNWLAQQGYKTPEDIGSVSTVSNSVQVVETLTLKELTEKTFTDYIKRNVMYFVTIKRVEAGDSWWYNGCNFCHEEVHLLEGRPLNNCPGRSSEMFMQQDRDE
ncbi:Ferric reduction oxidase 4 [Heracleum sosnowskyi]|uniref:ferric-chelate reductase (NADH) n=1 Tax=Heracleum sosnowskyi TaxID=360622 RepID=A0AAD8IX01_9APIA|nr:Ferric reduction oxidase 4 [Heracleum sosnowskyi]KAK1392777.1 Ferric reduction oxidase 4 [Heracleum sosnowskyi]